jgi:tRNA(Arg) A34 adenosine deaminase TadA
MSGSTQDLTAIIYDKRGRVLSIGKNSYIKTHPLQAKHAHMTGLSDKLFIHAEISAIVRCRDLSKAHKILVTRVGRNGDLLLAKPCPVCASAISEAGIKIIEHS